MKKFHSFISTLICTTLLIAYAASPAFATSEAPHSYTAEELKLLEQEQEIDRRQVEMAMEEARQFQSGQRLRSASIISKSMGSGNILGSFGDIIITFEGSSSSKYIGHAAIVSNNYYETIESYAQLFSPIGKDGVQRYSNQWAGRKGAKLYRVRGASEAQYKKAAQWSEWQVGKPYNRNFLDKNTTASFYCSQLVWRAWLEAGIDIEAGTNTPYIVSPSDIAASSNTVLMKVVR